MRCRACNARLLYDDNYCRKCGASIDVLDIEVVHASPARPVVALRQARQVAMPVVAQGTAMLLAGTLLRLLLRVALNRQQSPARSLLPFSRGSAIADGEVEEILYIRRTRLH